MAQPLGVQISSADLTRLRASGVDGLQQTGGVFPREEAADDVAFPHP